MASPITGEVKGTKKCALRSPRGPSRNHFSPPTPPLSCHHMGHAGTTAGVLHEGGGGCCVAVMTNEALLRAPSGLGSITVVTKATLDSGGLSDEGGSGLRQPPPWKFGRCCSCECSRQTKTHVWMVEIASPPPRHPPTPQTPARNRRVHQK